MNPTRLPRELGTFGATMLGLGAMIGTGVFVSKVREPRRTIPKAIILSALTVMLIYCAVAVVGIGVVGAEGLSAATDGEAAPLAVVAERFGPPLSVPVLVYYALTNLATLRISAEDRLYPRWVSWLGLVCCLGLAFWVDPRVWLTGLGLIVIGLLWHAVARRSSSR
ncbi:MAG TPA: hypothetical protein VMR74_10895 [Gammaproteobacteria bacterium]|nr:hypothetical protein [Gammaproteobacteria bacterium]